MNCSSRMKNTWRYLITWNSLKNKWVTTNILWTLRTYQLVIYKIIWRRFKKNMYRHWRTIKSCTISFWNHSKRLNHLWCNKMRVSIKGRMIVVTFQLETEVSVVTKEQHHGLGIWIRMPINKTKETIAGLHNMISNSSNHLLLTKVILKLHLTMILITDKEIMKKRIFKLTTIIPHLTWNHSQFR